MQEAPLNVLLDQHLAQRQVPRQKALPRLKKGLGRDVADGVLGRVELLDHALVGGSLVLALRLAHQDVDLRVNVQPHQAHGFEPQRIVGAEDKLGEGLLRDGVNDEGHEFNSVQLVGRLPLVLVERAAHPVEPDVPGHCLVEADVFDGGGGHELRGNRLEVEAYKGRFDGADGHQRRVIMYNV